MKCIVTKWFCLLGLICFTSCNSTAQENKIDTFMNILVSQKRISGAAVAALKDNQVVYTKNYGFADLENKTPITDFTAFNIMSITKLFIAIATMQLVNKRLINLDAPIKKYLSDLPTTYDSLLIYQLLNHSSGIPDFVHIKGYMAQANKTQTPMQVLSPILNKPLEFRPGENNAYSNSGYFLLGLLIEKESGKKLANYLKENIFNPAKMDDTYLEVNAGQNKLKAKGYTNINGDLKKEIELNPSQYWAAGGVVSTKNDLIKWDKALTSGLILPTREINEMMKSQKLNNGNESEYGLGFELMNMPTMKVAGNNGAGLGYNASNLFFLNDGITIIVLTNTSNSNSSMIAKNIRDIAVSEIGNRKSENYTSIKMDKLDSLVIQVFNDAKKSSISPVYFNDSASFNKFKAEAASYIQSKGNLLTIQMKGEKVNPQTIVRRYEIDFGKEKIMFVIIFSVEGKIILINHM